MERAAKQQLIDEVSRTFASISSIVLADFRGMDVATVTGMRAEFRKSGCGYRVVKNTLIKIAVKDTSMAPMVSLLNGPTAVIWSTESPSLPAKLAVKFAKEQQQKFRIKGGFFEGQLLDAVGVEQLSKMPGKPELQASLLMTFLAAPTDLVRTLAAGPMNFLYLLQARERNLGGA
ncbi:MAG TPA: 50S ribosomal protein L10 [Kofleriaceae bacterium]|nr:50S ribosomal protein L10 [Kofleriaceae bacterium]